MGHPPATMAQINQIEQENLLIDAVALGNAALSTLSNIPGSDIPSGASFGPAISYFETVRDQNNAQIDILLNSLGLPRQPAQ